MNKLTYSDTLTILKHPAAATEFVPLQEPLLLDLILGQTGMVERQHYSNTSTININECYH